jgi:hypothetical protein
MGLGSSEDKDDDTKPIDSPIDPLLIGYLYMFNPFAVMTCLAQSTGMFNSFAVWSGTYFASRGGLAYRIAHTRNSHTSCVAAAWGILS